MTSLHEFLFLHRGELKQGIVKEEWAKDILENLELFEVTDLTDTTSDLLSMYEKILEFIYMKDSQTTKLIDEIVNYCSSIHFILDDEYFRNSIEIGTKELYADTKKPEALEKKIGLQDLYETASFCIKDTPKEIPKEFTDFDLLSNEVSTLNYLLKFSDNDEIKKYIIKNIELYK